MKYNFKSKQKSKMLNKNIIRRLRLFFQLLQTKSETQTQTTMQMDKNKTYLDINQVKNLVSLRQIGILSKVLYVKNYQSSLRKWFVSLDINSQQQFTAFFNRYLQTVKPVIHQFSSITQNLDAQNYGFYSDSLTKEQIAKLQSIFKPLSNFQFLTHQELIQNPNNLLENQPDTHNQAEISIMDLNIPPQNKEIHFWEKVVQINKFQIQGTVVKGKGVGKNVLGMPTANIKISPQLNESLREYPFGIYVTTVSLKSQNRVYLGAASLGTNPHYENNSSQRILEIYILNDFGEQNIYDATIKVEFFYLIRLELDFQGFSPFLNGMRNDIQITKNHKSLISPS